MSRPFFGGQEVTCRKCRRTYTCTPENDYYNADSATTGVCFACLLTEGGMNPDTTPVRVIDLDGRSTDPRDLALRHEDGAK